MFPSNLCWHFFKQLDVWGSQFFFALVAFWLNFHFLPHATRWSIRSGDSRPRFPRSFTTPTRRWQRPEPRIRWETEKHILVLKPKLETALNESLLSADFPDATWQLFEGHLSNLNLRQASRVRFAHLRVSTNTCSNVAWPWNLMCQTQHNPFSLASNCCQMIRLKCCQWISL